MAKVKPPIVKQDGRFTVKDSGIFLSCSWTSGANCLQELSKLLQAFAAEDSLNGKREQLLRIVNTDGKEGRLEASQALMQLNQFRQDKPTEREARIFWDGMRVGELLTTALVLPHEQEALTGKRMQRGAATSRAKWTKKVMQKKIEIRYGVQELLRECPEMTITNARGRIAKTVKRHERTVIRHSKDLK